MDCVSGLKAQSQRKVPKSAGVYTARCLRWHVPPCGFFKCNVDTAIPVEQNGIELGMVVRMDEGSFLTCRMVPYNISFFVNEAEAFGLLSAMQWVRSLGLKQVIFEIDSKVVANVVCSPRLDVSEFGLLVQQRRSFMELEHVIRCALLRGKQMKSPIFLLGKLVYKLVPCLFMIV
ncbi:hypothetical protein PTKIN_Ptkin15bG0110200 [Pterospermum kingtungense]